MAGFMDFVENGGGASTVPWLTALLAPKKPQSNLNNIDPLFQQVAQGGAAQNAFADQNAEMYNNEYRPRAVALNDRASRIGSQADLNEASDRGAANFRAGYGARRAALSHDMTGVNPNSGGAMARRGALDVSYAPGLVDAMNKGRTGREAMGIDAQAKALPFLATVPSYGAGSSMMAGAAQGMAGLDTMRNNMWRQEVGDITKAVKMPWDTMDRDTQAKKDEARDQANREAMIRAFGGSAGRFPVQGYDDGFLNNAPASAFSFDEGM